MYIVDSSIISTYDVNKRHINFLNVSLFTRQPLIYHETDMTPWVRFPIKIGDEGLIPHFWWQLFFPPLIEIFTKHNIKKTESTGNIWGPFYMSKCEDLGES